MNRHTKRLLISLGWPAAWTNDHAKTDADYLTDWAYILSRHDYQLAIGYTDTGPTLDLNCDGHTDPVIRWLLKPADTGGHR